MRVPCLLLILWSLPGGIYSEANMYFCINQLGSIPVEVGGNVTISCSFSYPKSLDNTTKIRVYWSEGPKNPCRYSTPIYKHTTNWTHVKYTERISMVGNPEEENTASIRIQGVDRKDGPVLCCMVEVISDEEGFEKSKEISLDHNGTVLLFPDQTWVDQLDAVPAVRGEDVTIPCSLHYSSERRDLSIFVTWTKGRSATCPEDGRIHTWKPGDTISQNNRFSLVNYPDDISLIIKGVNLSDMDYYCCEVMISRQSTRVSVHGTELVVQGTGRLYNVSIIQPLESLAQPGTSSIINCSFTSTQENNTLNIRVYWRVGSPRGVYAYHPDKGVIDPIYKGRTELKGNLDLYIGNVQKEDETLYYCFLMLTLCVSTSRFKTVVDHGQGTKLTVKKSPSIQTLRIILTARIIVFCVVIVSGILGYRHIRQIVLKR